MLVKVAASNLVHKYSSIACIGGGIGGLAVANALKFREGLADRVTVYEQAPHFTPTAGAGFGFSPNGQICLSSIGIDDYHQLGQPYDHMVRLDASGLVVVAESDVLRQIRERHGFGLAGCLRADIVDLMVQRLKEHSKTQEQPVLQYSHTLTRITPTLDKVELEFESGHQDVVDLVIGADGIHSTVAKLLNIDDNDNPSIYSGANIFYGKIPNPERLEYFQDHPVFREKSVVNGPGTGEFIAFYVGAGDKKTFVWANTYVSDSPPQQQGPGKDDEEWSNQGTASVHELEKYVLPKYPDGHPIHDFASMTKEADLLHFGLFYRQHKSTWTDVGGRVALLGDSCHATLPYVGQGANQAIEDAIVLAECLEKYDDHATAYKEYYDRRFPRTKRIVQIAGLLDKLYHSKSWFMQMITDYVLKSVINGGAVMKQMEKEIVEENPVKDFQKYIPAGAKK